MGGWQAGGWCRRGIVPNPLKLDSLGEYLEVLGFCELGVWGVRVLGFAV